MTVLVPRRRILRPQLSIPRLNFRRLGDPSFNRLGIRGQPWGCGGLFPRAAAAAWSPPDSSNLVFWLDADAITGLSDDDPVSTWEDQQNSNDFTESLTLRPTYKTGIQNGRAVVRYDGVNDVLRNATASASSGPITVIAAYNATDATGPPDKYILDIQTGRRIVLQTRLVDEIGWYDGDFQLVATATTGAQVMVWVLQSSGGELFRDGSSIGTDTYSEAAIGGTLAVGNRYTLENVPFAGDMFEVALYKSALSTANRQSWEDELSSKWGTP